MNDDRLSGGRRGAIRNDSPSGVDATAVHEVMVNANDMTVKQLIANVYNDKLPDSKLSNSNCSSSQLLTGINNPIQRFKRWKDEDYFIVGVSFVYKLMTVLNLILIVAIMTLAFYTWHKKCEIQIVTKSDSTSTPEEVAKLNTLHRNIGTYLNVTISVLLFIYASVRVFKRTTRACANRVHAMDE